MNGGVRLAQAVPHRFESPHRGCSLTGELPDKPRKRRRKVPWAAPVSAGLAAAAASVLTASVDWEIPPLAKIAVTGAAAVLVGLTTWATTETREPRQQALPAPGSLPPDQWPP